MEWANPVWLVAIPPITILWCGVLLWGWYRNQRARAKFANAEMLRHLVPSHSSASSAWQFAILSGLQMLGVCGLLLALAGPRYGDIEQPVFSSGHDIYVLLDVSKSMLAEDVTPSRLERAKADIASLSNLLKGERIGLIVFAGQAVIQCPLTVDYENFRKAVQNVDILSSPRGGTVIGNAIRKAMVMFNQNEGSKHSILLITDGDDQDSAPLAAAQEAAAQNIPLYIIGLGDTDTGARVPVGSSTKSYVEFEGSQVWSKLDSKLLSDMAQTTNGAYVAVGTNALDLNSLYRNYLVRSDVGASTSEESLIVKAEQFQWPLGIGIAFLVLSMCRPSEFLRRRLPSGSSSHSTLELLNTSPGQRSNRPQGAAVRLAILLSFCAPDVVQVNAESTSRLNQQALQHFEHREFEKAEASFLAAKEALNAKDPKQAIFDYNLGCTAFANGDLDLAIKYFQSASRSADSSLIADAQFQVGSVLAAQLSDWIESDTTNEINNSEELQLANRAIEAFENALAINPSFEQARLSIEHVKLWMSELKQLTDDAEKKEAFGPLNMLATVEFLKRRQMAIAQELKDSSDFAKLDVLHRSRLSQQKLREDLLIMSDKLGEEVSFSKNVRVDRAAINNDQLENGQLTMASLQEVTSRFRDVVDGMERTENALARFQGRSAYDLAQTVVSDLDGVWIQLAPLKLLLARGYETQQELIKESVPSSTRSSSASDPKDAKTATSLATNPLSDEHIPAIGENGWAVVQMSNAKVAEQLIRRITQLLEGTAEDDPNYEASQRLSEPETDVPEGASSSSELEEVPASTGEPSGQLDQNTGDISEIPLRALLEKARMISQEASREMSSALETSADENWDQTRLHATEAKRLLEELLKLLQPPAPNDSSEQDSQENNQDSKQDKDSSQQEQKNESSKSDANREQEQQPSKGDANSEDRESDTKQGQDGEKKNEKSSSGEEKEASETSDEETSSSKQDANDSRPDSDTESDTESDTGKDSESDSGNESETSKEESSEQTEPSNTDDSESKDPQDDELHAEDGKDEGTKQPATAEESAEGDRESESSAGGDKETNASESSPLLVSKERMDEILRKVKEREAAKRIRDRKFQEMLRSRQRVERDW